jgi:nitronate monooxygenase
VIDPLYRRTLFEARAARTCVTSALSGRPARAIVTRFIEEMSTEAGGTPEFPLQRMFTAHLARESLARGNPEFHALWAGQAAPLLRHQPAAELLATLGRETEAALGRAR